MITLVLHIATLAVRGLNCDRCSILLTFLHAFRIEFMRIWVPIVTCFAISHSAIPEMDWDRVHDTLAETWYLDTIAHDQRLLRRGFSEGDKSSRSLDSKPKTEELLRLIYAIEESLILTPLYRGTLLDDVENLRIANLTWHNLEAENDSKFAENYPDGRLDALRKKIASILKSFGSAEELESAAIDAAYEKALRGLLEPRSE